MFVVLQCMSLILVNDLYKLMLFWSIIHIEKWQTIENGTHLPVHVIYVWLHAMFNILLEMVVLIIMLKKVFT
jgi:hypothetical protein